MIDAGEQEKFDKDMELALRSPPSTRSMRAVSRSPVRCTSAYQFAAARDPLTDEIVGQPPAQYWSPTPPNERIARTVQGSGVFRTWGVRPACAVVGRIRTVVSTGTPR